MLREPLYFPDFRGVRASAPYENIRMPPRTEPISPRHLPIRGRRGFKSDTTPTKLLKRIVQAGAIVGDSKLDRHETRCLHAVSWCERACQHPVDHPARMHYIELLLEAAQYHEFLQARSTLEKEVSSYEQNLMLERAAKEKSMLANKDRVKDAVQEAAQQATLFTKRVQKRELDGFCRSVLLPCPGKPIFSLFL